MLTPSIIDWTQAQDTENPEQHALLGTVLGSDYSYLVFAESVDLWSWTLHGPDGAIIRFSVGHSTPDKAKESAQAAAHRTKAPGRERP